MEASNTSCFDKKSPKRVEELEREITGITPTMLTTQLRKLEAKVSK